MQDTWAAEAAGPSGTDWDASLPQNLSSGNGGLDEMPSAGKLSAPQEAMPSKEVMSYLMLIDDLRTSTLH